MSDDRRIRFATDLVTYFSPAFWGGEGDLGSIGDLFTWGQWDPKGFWERVLDSTQEAGLDGIEITFHPGSWTTAKAAYGSAVNFAAAVRERGLEVCSGFLSSRDPISGRTLDFANPDDHETVLEIVDGYARFLNACGAEIMVTALPLRTSRDATPPRFVDLKTAAVVADLLNRAGATALRHGVTLALPPEAFTRFRNSRDVDRFMLLTDPTYIGLCPDTAQFTVAGSDPIEIVSRHRDRLVLTHWKDAVGPAPADVPIDETIWARQVQWFGEVGTGVVDWPAWARLLRDLNYRGWAVFELDTAADPVANLKAIKRYVQNTVSHIYR
jgi:sugar phosphate isomerase/epimerase